MSARRSSAGTLPPALAVLSAALLLSGCRCREQPAPEPAAPADDTAPPPAIPEDPVAGELAAMFSCSQNRDCLNSCRHGAVNRDWYATHYPGGENCRDGCAASGYRPPRCLDGICTAFRDGEPDPDCTRREIEILVGPGPAHACAEDGDCMASCLYGAVNGGWYAASPKTRGECRGGCAAKGIEVRCVDGGCAAFRGERIDADCTRRPIFEVYM